MSSFDGAGLQDLRAMIADGDPGGLDAVASKWSAVHDALRQAQDDLLQHTLAATNHWQGAAADAFAARADELHQSLGSGAAFAFNASSGVSCAADALRTAQAAMPRETPRATASAIVRQATATDAAPAEFQEQQRQRAVAVMQRLEERYAAAAEMIGNPTSFDRSEDRGIFRSNETLDGHRIRAAQSVSAISDRATQSSRPSNSARITETPPWKSKSGQISTEFQRESLDSSMTTRSVRGGRSGQVIQPPVSSGNPISESLTGTPITHSPFESIPGNDLTKITTIDPLGPSRQDLQATLSHPLTHTTETCQRAELTRPITITPGNRTLPQPRPEGISNRPAPANWEPEIIGGIRSGHATSPSAAEIGGRTAVPIQGAEYSGIAASGSMPSSGQFSSRKFTTRRRPKYLKEDEQTWLPQQPANPPVII